MKKWITLLVALMIFTGCSTELELETMGSIQYEPDVIPQAGYIHIMLPALAAEETMADAISGKRYTWDEYELRLETREAGDVYQTLKDVTGMEAERLTLINRQMGELNTWQTVWTTAGEEGLMVGRILVADDGYYHYCMSLIGPEESDTSQLYADLVSSFSIRETDIEK